MQKCSSMLYVFDVLRASGGTDWIKIGFTSQTNPWVRISNGFWTNVHPPELCGCLSPDNLDLIFLFQGDQAVEAVVHSLFPPDHGEFWKKDRQDEMIKMIRLMCHEIPIPPRPALLDVSGERLPCCGGETHECRICGKNFKRIHTLLEHQRDVHQRRRIRCACGADVTKRNINQHQQSKRHKKALTSVAQR